MALSLRNHGPNLSHRSRERTSASQSSVRGSYAGADGAQRENFFCETRSQTCDPVKGERAPPLLPLGYHAHRWLLKKTLWILKKKLIFMLKLLVPSFICYRIHCSPFFIFLLVSQFSKPFSPSTKLKIKERLRYHIARHSYSVKANIPSIKCSCSRGKHSRARLSIGWHNLLAPVCTID